MILLTNSIQTFYLTLDLSAPSIPCVRKPTGTKTGRGGYKTTWINPGLGRQKRQLGRAPTISLQKNKASANATPTPTPARDDDDMEDDEPEDDVDTRHPTEWKEAGAQEDAANEEPKPAEAATEPENIQILDLHSENPIISYKGHNFSCRWAENLGTELLFTFRDPEKPLPVLRSLKDNVDLLAASSARLISTPVTFEPKPGFTVDIEEEDNQADDEEKEEDDDEEDIAYVDINGYHRNARGGFMIPIGRAAKEPRREQARFLERLTEVKRQKGEEDGVTIKAQRRLYPAGWRRVMKQKRDAERVDLRSRLRQLRTGDPQAQEALRRRLEEINREEQAMNEEETLRKDLEENGTRKKKPGRKGKVHDDGQPVRRPRGFPIRKQLGRPPKPSYRDDFYEQMRAPTPSMGSADQSMLSTPTPHTWDELGDEDAPGEVDDGYYEGNLR
jgi:hypothetical protein